MLQAEKWTSQLIILCDKSSAYGTLMGTMQQDRSVIYGSVVWILSGLALISYACIGLTQTNIPGVEQLVDFVQSAEGNYIFLAAFIAILIEGLYFIGSVFLSLIHI